MAVNCAQVSKLKEAYIDGLLGADARAEINAHADGCALCRERLQVARKVSSGMRAAVRANVAGAALSPKRSAVMQANLLQAYNTEARSVAKIGWRWSAVGAPALGFLLVALAMLVAWQSGTFNDRSATQLEPQVVNVPTLEPAPTRALPTQISEPTATVLALPELVLATPPPAETTLPVLPVTSDAEASPVIEPTLPAQPTSTRAIPPTREVGRSTPTRVGTRTATSTVGATVTPRIRRTVTRPPRPSFTPWPTWTRYVPPTRWPMSTPWPTRTRYVPQTLPTWTALVPTQEPTPPITYPTDTPLPIPEPTYTPVPTHTPEPEPTEEPTTRPERTPTPLEMTRTAEPTWPRPTRTMHATPTKRPQVTRTPFPTRTRPPFPYTPGD